MLTFTIMLLSGLFVWWLTRMSYRERMYDLREALEHERRLRKTYEEATEKLSDVLYGYVHTRRQHDKGMRN